MEYKWVEGVEELNKTSCSGQWVIVLADNEDKANLVCSNFSILLLLGN